MFPPATGIPGVRSVFEAKLKLMQLMKESSIKQNMVTLDTPVTLSFSASLSGYHLLSIHILFPIQLVKW